MTTKQTTTPEPILKVVIDLTGRGIESTHVYASTTDLRDEALRLTQAMPILEMLEAELKKPLQ